MQYFVEIIKALSWPIAIIWLGYLFKGEIRNLFARVSTLKYKDIEAKFEKELQYIDNELSQTNPAPPKELTIEHINKQEQLLRIAEVSPRAAIMEAWINIETAAKRAGLTSGSAMPRVFPQNIVEHLLKNKNLPESSIELFHKLRQLRNQAAHLPEFAISQNEAEKYLEISSKITELLENE